MPFSQLQLELNERAAAGLLRQRRTLERPQQPHIVVEGKPYLSFCSNDYLGLANHPRLVAALQQGAAQWGAGAGSAHLVNGHFSPHQLLEDELAAFVGKPAALLFSTGYMANLGVVQALAGRGDTVFADKLNHASLNDAMRLSRAHVKRYRHNDLAQLAALLAETHTGRKLVCTDAVFSMDGDAAPLPELLALCEQYDAWLYVDDAHGFGVLGEQGRGSLNPPPAPLFQSGEHDTDVDISKVEDGRFVDNSSFSKVADDGEVDNPPLKKGGRGEHDTDVDISKVADEDDFDNPSFSKVADGRFVDNPSFSKVADDGEVDNPPLKKGGRGDLGDFQRIIYMATLGKAAGVFGAFVAAEPVVINYLVNQAHSYVYTTAAPPALAVAVRESLRLIAEGDARRAHLQCLIAQLKSGLAGLPWALMPSATAIQPLLVGDNQAALALSLALRERGLWVAAIRPPTVPAGTARLRITLSAAHTTHDVTCLIEALHELAR